MNKIINKNKGISNGTRKGIIFILLAVFLLFIYARIVFASFSFGSIFAGRIINTKALEIEALEMFGYECAVPGTTIATISIGSPAGTPLDYFIPSFVTPRTRTTPRTGQLIIGKYSGKTAITCILPGDPPDVQTVSLDTITFFGTSR